PVPDLSRAVRPATGTRRCVAVRACGRGRGRDGAQRIGQEHAAGAARRPRRPGPRRGADRGDRLASTVRRRAVPVLPTHVRIHRPRAGAPATGDGHRERGAAGAPRRLQRLEPSPGRRCGVGPGGTRGPRHEAARPALGRGAATGVDRPGARPQAGRGPGRRTDRQPRLGDRGHRRRAAGGGGPGARRRGRPRHARPGRRRVRRSDGHAPLGAGHLRRRGDREREGCAVTTWLLWRTLRRAPRRLLLEATGVAFPVAILAATLLFVDQAVQTMTAVALQPVLTEMRVVAGSLDVDIAAVSGRLSAVPDVQRAEPFAAVNVVVAPGTSGSYSARLFAVDPDYLRYHAWLH